MHAERDTRACPGFRNVVVTNAVITLTLCLVTSCEQQASKQQSSLPPLQKILSRAYDAAGGLETYHGLQEISYTKRSVLYLEDGTTESDVTQQHRYELHPDLAGEITWTVDSVSHQIIYRDNTGQKLVNNVPQEVEPEAATGSFLSAYYVAFLPFKLADPGADLSYAGTDTLDSGTAVDVIRAEYHPGDHDNLSTSDTWWFYFDRNNSRHVASLVYHPPTFAYIENTEFTDSLDLRFNTYRRSWRTDSLRNKQFLRGEFWYSHFVLR